MPVDPQLLVKAAKVYDAAEPLENMKPKEVYESHKKCAPGEFGMNKEGAGLNSEVEDIGGTEAPMTFSARNTADYPLPSPADLAKWRLQDSQRELDYLKRHAAGNNAAATDLLRATTAAKSVAPFFGNAGRFAANTAHNVLSGAHAIDSLYAQPRDQQLAEYNVAQAKQQLENAKNPWERNVQPSWAPGAAQAPVPPQQPAPQPFKPTGVPGFVNRVAEQIGNFKLPRMDKKMFKALHPSVSRPFDAQYDKAGPGPAVQFGQRVNRLLGK